MRALFFPIVMFLGALPAQQSLIANLQVASSALGATDGGARDFVVAGNKVYFTGNTAQVRSWVSDTTRPGTVPLLDAMTAAGSFVPLGIGDEVLLLVDLPDLGLELWRSNGEPGGTTLVLEIRPGPGDGVQSNLVRIGNLVYFVADDGIHARELWCSDGTAAGTTMLTDIPGGEPTMLTPVGDELFFMEVQPSTGRELWRSDGTGAGTHMVAESVPGPDGFTTVLVMQAFGDGVLFEGNNLCWYSDGTIVRQITSAGAPHRPVQFLDIGAGVALFVAQGVDNRLKLWRTDGTVAGTSIVDAPLAVSGSNPIGPMVRLGDAAIFALQDSNFETEPWRSDGTVAGTFRLADLNPGNFSSDPQWLTRVGDEVWFAASVVGIGTELFATDGTPAGTGLKVDMLPGPASSGPRYLTDLGDGRVICTSQITFPWREPTITDGTIEGSFQLAATRPESGGSGPREFTQLGDRILFQARQNEVGSELYETDGTPQGTALLADIYPGNPLLSSSSPSNFCALGDQLLFVARTSVGRELWITDGTAAGTAMVYDTPGTQAEPWDLTAFGPMVAFSQRSANGREPWVTNGTTAGTFELLDINAGPDNSDPWPMIPIGDRLFFGATDGVHGRELWISDGTTIGTTMVADIAPGAASPRLGEMIAYDGALFFSAAAADGQELWRSDGTATNTALFVDLFPGPGHGAPENLTVAAGLLFFTANDGSGDGRALWRTDGTAAGTMRLADIDVDPAMVVTGTAATIDGLFLVGGNQGNGPSLWFSDGTAAGTVEVLDLGPSTYGGIDGASLIPILGGTMVAFVANDLVHGKQVWVSGPSPGSAMMLSDFAFGGSGAFAIEELTAIGNDIYARVDEPVNGVEPWRFSISATSIAFQALYGTSCVGAANPTLTITAASPPTIGNADFGVRLTGPDLETIGFLFAGFYPADFNLGNQCRLAIHPPIELFAAVPVTAGAPTTAPLPIPATIAWAGQDVFWQWAVLHPNPQFADLFQLSGGLQTHFGF